MTIQVNVTALVVVKTTNPADLVAARDIMQQRNPDLVMSIDEATQEIRFSITAVDDI